MAKANLNLYNKYRPKCFQEVIGQSMAKNLLIQSLEQKKPLQAFIFYGPHGTGKTSMARIFAKACNCKNFDSKSDACNDCESCRMIEDGKTTDIYEVDAASHSGVEHMRELIQNSHYVALNLKKKIYIIDEAHNLSSSAWNSLLKTIEEPHSENIIFLFLTTNIHKIPETILSRCQKHNFSKLKDEELRELVEKVINQEEREMEAMAIESLISLSQGSARECLSLLDQIFVITEKNISLKDVEQTFRLSNKKDLLKLIEILEKNDLSAGIEFINNLLSLDRNLLNYFSQLLSILIELYAYESTLNPALLRNLSKEEADNFINKNLNFLQYGEILEKAIYRYEWSRDTSSWAHLTLFYLSEVSPTPPIKTKIETTKTEIHDEEIREHIEVQIPEPQIKIEEPEITEVKKSLDFQIDLNLEKPKKTTSKLSKELESKALYGISDIYRNEEKSKENYMLYKESLESDRISPELIQIFKKVKPIQKQILTTDKTIILCFEEEIDADKLNELTKYKEIQKELEDLFMAQYTWIGLSIEQLKHYSQLKKQPNFKEVSPEIFNAKSGKEKEFLEALEILKET